MSKYTWLIDCGHGGIICGSPVTKGKRSPKWSDGSQLIEGEFNRGIGNRLIELCAAADIKTMSIHQIDLDLSLAERVLLVNTTSDLESPCILISIHANAGGGNGFEVYTSRGETKSDLVAEIFAGCFSDEFAEVNIRSDYSDGDADKEANFMMLTKTKCPAILLESFFMDNESECRTYLMSKSGRDRIARAYFNAILEVERKL